MTAIVPTPAAPDVPQYPALGSANFNQGAYTYGSSMPGVTYRIWEIGKSAEINATASKESAEAASGSVTSAQIAASAANTSKNAAAQSEANALAYAQAAGASAGIPPAVPNKVLSTNSGGGVVWSDVPNDSSKLDKLSGVSTNLGQSYIDKETIAAGGTAAISVLDASVQRVQAGGNLTLTISGWSTDGRSETLELHCVNFGGKTITWPAGNWIKNDGSYAAAVSNSGVVWQTAGTDRVLVMRDAGQIVYKVMR